MPLFSTCILFGNRTLLSIERYGIYDTYVKKVCLCVCRFESVP